MVAPNVESSPKVARMKSEKKFNFTDANIERLPKATEGTRYTVYDESLSGLIVRVNDKGKKVFYVYKKMRGNPSPIKVKIEEFSREGFGVEKARSDAADIMGDMRKGKNPNIEKKRISDDMTLKRFWDEKYKPNHLDIHKAIATQKTDNHTFKTHLEPLHKRKMLSITQEQIDILHKKVGGNSGVHTANRMIALLRHIFNKAIEWGFDGKNPATNIIFFKTQNRRRYIKSDEMKPFFDALAKEENEVFKNYVLASLFTGQRRRNVQAYRWDNLDLGNGFLYIPDTKNGEPMEVPLVDEAITLFKEMKEAATSEWLFPSATSKSGHLEEPKKMWAALLARAGIENLRIHDLRRTLGSYLAMTGAPLLDISKALGHKSTQSTLIYAQLASATVRKGTQKATKAILALTRDEEDA